MEFKHYKYQCVEVLYTADGETQFSPDPLDGLPGSPERKERLSMGYYAEGNENDYIRDILPAEIANDPYALLSAYLKHFGFDVELVKAS